MNKWEAGCYGDGAFGHQHTRERCADIIMSGPMFEAVRFLVEQLRGEMSDDAWEEDFACEHLNTFCLVDGHFWGWQDGDFGLWSEDYYSD